MEYGYSDSERAEADAPERDPYYCPGCGKGFAYPAACTGSPVAPHPAIQTVDSAELDEGPESHTPAPPSDVAA